MTTIVIIAAAIVVAAVVLAVVSTRRPAPAVEPPEDLVRAVDEMRTKMMAMLREDKDPRALGEGAIFDTYKYVGGRGKGYETWLKAQEAKLAGEPLPLTAPKQAQKRKRDSNEE